MRPGCGSKFPPSLNKGRRECRAPDAPRGLVCNGSVRCAHEHTGHTGITRHSPRNGLRLITCSPRRPGFLPPSSARLSANLTPASGCRAHTILPSASGAVVLSTLCVHRSPPRERDDRDSPLSVGRDGEGYSPRIFI